MADETIDLLDCTLGREWRDRQKIPEDILFTAYRREYTVAPANWEKYCPEDWVFGLSWSEYRYCEIQTKEKLFEIVASDEPGIYIFYTRHAKALWQMPRFPLYAGISGERAANPNRPLRDRLAEYLPGNISTITKRDNIHQMLKLYFPDVWVAFACAGAYAGKLKDVEEAIHGFLHPTFARRDFPAKIKDMQKAFGTV